MVAFLLQRSIGFVLPAGVIKEAARVYRCHRKTIGRLWKTHTETRSEINALGDVKSAMVGNCGRKGHNLGELCRKMGEIPLEKRMTIRSLAFELGVSTHAVTRGRRTASF